MGPWQRLYSRNSGGFSGASARLHHHSDHGLPAGREKAVRRVRKISNAHIFEPVVAREVARHRLLDEILSLFGGRAQPMMAQLAEAGKLTLDDVRQLEQTIRKRIGTEGGARAQMIGERQPSVAIDCICRCRLAADALRSAGIVRGCVSRCGCARPSNSSSLLAAHRFRPTTRPARTCPRHRGAVGDHAGGPRGIRRRCHTTSVTAAHRLARGRARADLGRRPGGDRARAVARMAARSRGAPRQPCDDIEAAIPAGASSGTTGARRRRSIAPVLLFPDGIAGRIDAAAARLRARTRVVPRAPPRQSHGGDPHGGGGAVLVPPAGVVDGCAHGRRRERACDEAVLSLGSAPTDYAEAILGVCKLYVESPLACVTGVTGANLKKRIEAIMKNQAREQVNLWKKLLLGAAIMLVVGVPVGVGVLADGTPGFGVAAVRFGRADRRRASFRRPDHLAGMIDRIRTNWEREADVAGANVIQFTIQRDGQIVDVVVEQSSGLQSLDARSRRALLVTKILDPLPDAFPNPR